MPNRSVPPGSLSYKETFELNCPQVAKKLVESDYKHNRVEDPTKITPSQERHVKKHVTEFFEKAVLRKRERDDKDAAKKKQDGLPQETTTVSVDVDGKQDEESDAENRMDMSDDEDGKPQPETLTPIRSTTPMTPAEQFINGERLKRKRDGEAESHGVGVSEAESTPKKQLRSETPPPPPPPPPAPAPNSPEAVILQHVSSLRDTAPEGPIEQSQVMVNGVSSPPQAPPVSSHMDYAQIDDTCAEDDADISPMLFNGISGTSSDNEEMEMNGVHGTMQELGLRQVPELQGQ